MRRLHLAQGTYSNPRLWGKGFLTPVRYATGADGRSLPMVFPDLGWEQLPRPPRRRVRRPKDPEPARGRHVRLGDGVLRPGRHVRISLRTSAIVDGGANIGPLEIARLFYFFHMLAVGFTA